MLTKNQHDKIVNKADCIKSSNQTTNIHPVIHSLNHEHSLLLDAWARPLIRQPIISRTFFKAVCKPELASSQHMRKLSRE